MELIACIIIVVSMAIGALGVSIISRPSITKHFEKYKHHGTRSVWVRSDLKGLHKDFCLCFDCKRFHPGSKANCPVAKTLYRLCIDHDLVTPVWECPRFLQDPFGWHQSQGRDALIS